MKKILLVGFLSIGLSACHKDAPAGDDVAAGICSDEQAIAAGASSGIANALGCKDEAAISADLMSVLGKANTCVKATAAREALHKKALDEKSETGKEKGIIGDLICPPVSVALVNFLSGKLPSGWKCDGGKTATMAEAAFSKFCAASIPL